jgi:hypothetical protein
MNIPLTLRLVKGSKLTFAELDTNFVNLRNAIISVNNSDTFVTGGTYNPITTSLDFSGNTGFNPFSVDVSALLDDTNTYTTGATLNGSVIEFDRTDLTNAYNVDIQPILDNYLPLQITGNTLVTVDNSVLGFSGNSTFSGITYNGDYSINYTNRSLVDKEYVDLAIFGSSQTLSQTLSNGNTTNGNNIIVSSGDTIYGNDLLLSGDTSITSKIENVNFISEVEVTENRVGIKSLSSSGDYSESFVAPLEFQSIIFDGASSTNLTGIVGQNNGGLPLLTLQATDTIGSVQDVLNFDPANTGSGTGLVSLATSTSEYSQITLTPSQLQIKSDDLVDSRNVTITPTTIQVNGGFAEYDADYSTNFVNRSLVDKEYVDNLVFSSTTNPYVEYKALLTQTGTSAPDESILVDTMGGGIWSYSDVGSYYFTKVGAFSASSRVEVYMNNTIVLSYTMSNPAFNIYSINRLDDDTIEVRTSTWSTDVEGSSLFVSPPGASTVSDAMSNDLLYNNLVSIRVWS